PRRGYNLHQTRRRVMSGSPDGTAAAYARMWSAPLARCRRPGIPIDHSMFGEDPAMASNGHTRSSLWGHGVVLAAGLALVGLMAYTLGWVGEGRSGLRHEGQADVAVFVPDRTDWVDVREGISACVRKGLVRLVREAGDQVIVETPVYRHPIRFTWRPVRGMAQTQSEVRRLAEQDEPPVAVVGSNNTVCTVALADGLREAAKSS